MKINKNLPCENIVYLVFFFFKKKAGGSKNLKIMRI